MDSSTIISVSEKCLSKILQRLSKENDFIVPEKVEYETVLRPLQIKRFELNALRIRKAIREGTLKVRKNSEHTKELSGKIMELANNSFYTKHGSIQVIQQGEAEMLALAKELKANAVAVDERNTRLIIERPFELENILKNRVFGTKTNKKNLMELNSMLSKLKVLRSTELMAMAFEEELFEPELLQEKQSIEAVLYAVKFAGCAVSFEEIRNYLKEMQWK